MKIERIIIRGCCGKTSLVFKTEKPLTKDHLELLKKIGFNEYDHFTSAGRLYVDNSDFTIIGLFGSDRFTIKCKHAECAEKLNNLEFLFQRLE